MNNHFISIDSAELNKFFKQMDRFSAAKQAAVKKVIAQTTFRIDAKAKQNAPYKTGLLRSSTSPEIIAGGLTGQVKTKVKYAAYREFGTGRFVRVPSGYEAYAIQFKGQGQRQVNSKPHPFLIPAAESERAQYIESLKQAFNETSI